MKAVDIETPCSRLHLSINRYIHTSSRTSMRVTRSSGIHCLSAASYASTSASASAPTLGRYGLQTAVAQYHAAALRQGRRLPPCSCGPSSVRAASTTTTATPATTTLPRTPSSSAAATSSTAAKALPSQRRNPYRPEPIYVPPPPRKVITKNLKFGRIVQAASAATESAKAVLSSPASDAEVQTTLGHLQQHQTEQLRVAGTESGAVRGSQTTSDPSHPIRSSPPASSSSRNGGLPSSSTSSSSAPSSSRRSFSSPPPPPPTSRRPQGSHNGSSYGLPLAALAAAVGVAAWYWSSSDTKTAELAREYAVSNEVGASIALLAMNSILILDGPLFPAS